MAIIILENNTKVSSFFTKNIGVQSKRLSDFKKFIIKTGNIKKENISNNIDNFLYK